MDAKVIEALSILKRYISDQPQIGIILGSGLGGLVEEIENPVSVRFEDIPHFPVSSVDGHRGEVLCGTLCGEAFWHFPAESTTMRVTPCSRSCFRSGSWPHLV